jgi:hypothetical protein
MREGGREGEREREREVSQSLLSQFGQEGGGGDDKTQVFAFRVSCFISKSQREREREGFGLQEKTHFTV